MQILKFLILVLLSSSCNEPSKKINQDQFIVMMHKLAKSWSNQDTDSALSCFSDDAIYMEPPNVQYFRGHRELRPYFDELTDQHKMTFHNLWFDEKIQSGAGEFTFSYGQETADVGIVTVEVSEGKISNWREYHTKGPLDFESFIEIDKIEWKWHIGNYPVPNDTL